MSFLFGGNTGMTYEEMMAKRKLAEGLVGGLNNAPRNVGEGWSAIGAALASRIAGNKANKAETAGREGASSVFADLFQRQLGGGQGAQGSMAGGLSNTFAATPRSEGQQVANDAMGAIGKPARGGNRDAFIEQMMPHAIRVAQQTGLDPRLVIAQAAQETGWGKSAPGNNYFGIKSHGKGGGNTFATNEVVNGQTVRINDSFRGYGDMGDSADGYASFLQENPRYNGMLSAQDLEGQLAELGRSGYATDPNYAASVGSIAQSISLPEGYQQGVDPALIEAMGNPYMSEQQRSALGMILQQRIAASAPQDPMQQIEYEKAQLELERMRNPQGIEGKAVGDALVNPITGEVIYQGAAKADPTTSQRDYSFYAQQEAEQGRQPLSFNEWDLQSRKAGATTVNNNLGENPSMIGTIPQGYTAIADPNEPSGYRMVAISGGPEDQSAQAAVAASNQAIASDTITTAASRARDAATSRQLTGPLGAIAAYNPASQNAEVYRQVDVLKSNAKIGNLQAMRDASPTGGALGAVTEKELQMLADKSGALNPASPNFLRDLDDYERTMLRIVHGYEAGDQVFSATRKDPPPNPSAANSGAAPTHRFNPATGKIEMIGGN